MFETMITVVGNVVDSPRKARVNSSSVTNFRVASTPRRFDSTAQRFVDGETFFVDVECWDELSNHVSGSVSAGDPVVVLGAISTSQWVTDAGRRSKPRIRARVVGHNLSWGISSFTKLKRAPVVSDAQAIERGVPVDPSDEQYAGAVDELTGELLEPADGDASEEVHEFLAGRDYVTDPATLQSMTTGDLAAEPAHA